MNKALHTYHEPVKRAMLAMVFIVLLLAVILVTKSAHTGGAGSISTDKIESLPLPLMSI